MSGSTSSSGNNATSLHRMRKGDWVCSIPQCGKINFAHRTSCYDCGKYEDETSKKTQLGVERGPAVAHKNHGLSSTDDWQCSTCGNVNWACHHCNTCHAPKYGEVDKRLGHTAEFNVRGIVEYDEGEKSDIEYGEFDHENKFNVQDDMPIPNEESDITPTIKDLSHKEEEEESDDDDGGDLSKYDLSGWGDDNSHSPKAKRKRSRSPSSTTTSSSSSSSTSDEHERKRVKTSGSSSSSSSSSEVSTSPSP